MKKLIVSVIVAIIVAIIAVIVKRMIGRYSDASETSESIKDD